MWFAQQVPPAAIGVIHSAPPLSSTGSKVREMPGKPHYPLAFLARPECQWEAGVQISGVAPAADLACSGIRTSAVAAHVLRSGRFPMRSILHRLGPSGDRAKQPDWAPPAELTNIQPDDRLSHGSALTLLDCARSLEESARTK